ncbi:MAG: thiol-disulfide oxidoreductase DCC family protein [Cyanobacteria bacterium J06635_15]
MYCVIYDGNCNLCTSLVQFLEKLDKGDRFQYAPMQDAETLTMYGITPVDCELGMIVLDADNPQQRWQGSDAAEEIGRLLPMGQVFVDFYRSLPGMKPLGDRAYEQIRDNRYAWFGKRSQTYQSAYPICNNDDACRGVG